MFIANRISLCRYLSPTTHRCITNVATNNVEFDPQKMIKKQLACGVKINKKKSWSSTAVLEALEGTIGSSPTPGYEMISSPHFHISNQRKNNIKYKKSGIEAANYAIANITDSFKHSWDSGENIEIWLNNPQQRQQLSDTTSTTDDVVDDESSADNIIKAIHNNQMQVAVGIFRKLKEKQVEISTDVINQLFAYVSFYLGNAENKKKYQDKPINQFFDSSVILNSSLVDSMFNLIEKPNREQYNVYIRSLYYLQKYDDAIDIYHQHIQGKMDLDVDSCNALMVCAVRSKQVATKNFINEIYKHMNTAQICPNHETFYNMVYRELHYISDIEEFSEKCQRLFAEMQHCGLDVSVQIYHEILRSITSGASNKSYREEKIDLLLNMLEDNDKIQCHTPRDAVALSGMMKILGNEKNLAQVKKLYKIGTSGNKRKLMKNMDYEEFFYSYYMFALLNLDTLENIWSAKCQLIPSKTRFTGRHIVLFFNAIKREEAYQYLPLLILDLMKDPRAWNVVHQVFDFIVEKLNDMDEDTQTQLKHISIINFKAPNFVLKVPRTMDTDEMHRQQQHILNRSLQILTKCGDQSHTKFALQRIDKFGMKLTQETLNDCDRVREKHRLDELIRRIGVAEK